MKTYNGNPANVNRSVLGKITWHKKMPFVRGNYVLVTKDPVKSLWGYAGVLTSHAGWKTQTPMISSISENNLSELNENDICLLNTFGEIILVWEINSVHNALLVTEQCNCSCIMCPQPNRKHSSEQHEQNMKLLQLLDHKKTKFIGLTGGEPTLIADSLFEIIKTCRKKLPNASLALLTNGRRLKDFEFTKKLALLKHPDLMICLALYADTDKNHDHIVGVNGAFYESLSGLYNLALLRQKVEIRTVVHRLNFDRLPQLADFISRNFPFVLHIAFMGMEITGMSLKNIKELWIDPVNYGSQLRQAVLDLHRKGFNVSVYNLPLCLIHKDLWKFARKSISNWKNVYMPVCQGCSLIERCCGFFSTSGEWQSPNIRPIKDA